MNEGYSDQSPHGYFLKSLVGVYTFYPFEKTVPLRSLMVYSRAYWCRSGVAFRKILSNFFNVPVQVDFATGRWNKIPDEIRTKIGGPQACYSRLSKGAALGHKFWDQENEFVLTLGPLDLKTFNRFLKSGDLYSALRDFVNFYKKKQQYFRIRLKLKKEDVPVSTLGKGTRLGWHSWLRSRICPTEKNAVVSFSSLHLYTPKDLTRYYDQHGTLEVHS